MSSSRERSKERKLARPSGDRELEKTVEKSGEPVMEDGGGDVVWRMEMEMDDGEWRWRESSAGKIGWFSKVLCLTGCSSGSGVGGTGKKSRKPGVLARLAASI